MIKRLTDIALALVGLTLTAPLMLLVAVRIKRDDRGPVFYRAPRVGRSGVPFRMYKFRTMVVDADRIGGPSAADGDARITRVGAWLRRHKLDEIPQFLNVLRGEMSFVGPRPEVQQYVDLYTEEERAILSVRPGITDFATLWNAKEGEVLAGSPDPEATYLERIRPGKIRLQMHYVRQQSFLTDMSIIMRTVLGLFSTKPPEALAAIAEGRDPSAHVSNHR
jgi:lipopolysaccharide/colanic/teichoic acid biosynthesis glycosyltransferase